MTRLIVADRLVFGRRYLGIKNKIPLLLTVDHVGRLRSEASTFDRGYFDELYELSTSK